MAEQWQHPKNPIAHAQTMYQINCEIFGEFLEKKCENAFPYSGFRILKEGVEMLESSQSLAVEEELPCQRLSAAWGSSCGRTFHLNLSESSSIRPGLISYFFLHVETVLVVLSCKMSEQLLLRWSHRLYSFGFKQNKLAQPKGLWRLKVCTWRDLSDFTWGAVGISVVWYLS